MGRIRLKDVSANSPPNQRRKRETLQSMYRSANARAHEEANLRTNRHEDRSMQATIAAAEPEGDELMDGFEEVGWSTRMWRVFWALVLLPLCWVTQWTLLEQFSQAANQGFWQTAEFWYFAVGSLLMIGWFSSGLMANFFTFLYVFGHELTHALFVLACWGKVTSFTASSEGGHITTNKTNWLIGLSPYFVPIWAVLAVLFYGGLNALIGFSAGWDKVLYGVLGLTWTFHMVWTLWMLPKDQPDLQENGRFFSMVVILAGNLLVLVALFCVAGRGPVLENFAGFGREWLWYTATWGDAVWQVASDWIARQASK